MNEDGKFWVSIVAIIVAGIVSFTGTVYHYHVKNNIRMAKLGYEQVMAPGSAYYKWQKVKK